MDPALSELHKHLSVGSGNQIQSIEVLCTCACVHTHTQRKCLAGYNDNPRTYRNPLGTEVMPCHSVNAAESV